MAGNEGGGEMLSAEKRAVAAAPRTTQHEQVYQHCQSASSKIEPILADLLFGIVNPNLTRGERFLAWDRFDKLLRLFVEAKYGV